MKEKYLAIGLMSGTSFDGVDASIIFSDGEKFIESDRFESIYLAYPPEIKRKSLNLTTPYQIELLSNEITEMHIQAVEMLLKTNKLSAEDIDVIGFHGQTIFHKPDEGVTVQIGNPSLLNYQTKISVVSDFRRKDVAAGGQGAPLVPIYHANIIPVQYQPFIFVNIGGVANATYVSDKKIVAADIGPGCALIDDMMNRFYDKSYDIDGTIASSGTLQQNMLDYLLEDHFFQKSWPKSLDRDHFSNKITDYVIEKDPNDIITTLTHFTAQAIRLSLEPYDFKSLVISGGGAKNKYLFDSIVGDDFIKKIIDIKTLGLDSDFIESSAFAYLAIRYLKSLPVTFPETTGVSHPVVSGALYSNKLFL